MHKYVRAVSTIAILLASASMLVAQVPEANPFTGTWKLNIAKSEYKPGPAPNSQTVTIAPDGKTTIEEVLSDGTSRTWSFTPSGDSAVPIQGLENSTVITKRTGNVVEYTWNFNGVNLKGRSVLSSNGKTATYTASGTNKEGHPVHNVQLYHRQPS
jgi:hypothetical protein